jgi:arsenate reductase (thioredoxin)
MPDKKILVLCTGNSARSIMAEAILRKYAGDRFTIHSAGLDPKGVNPFTIKILREKGYDTGVFHSKGVGDFLGKMAFEYVIFVCDRAEKSCPVTFPGTLSRLSWPFEDPAAYEGSDAAKIERFRQIFDEIQRKVLLWLQDGKPKALHPK